MSARRESEGRYVLVTVADGFIGSLLVEELVLKKFRVRAIIPTIITQLLSGAQTIRLGSLHPTRDFNFVKNIVKGFIAIASCDEAIGEELNIVSEQEISIGELARTLIDEINPCANIFFEDQRLRPEKSEVNRFFGDNTKQKKFTGWHSEYTLKQGLKETIAWFKTDDNLLRYKLDIYNV